METVHTSAIDRRTIDAVKDSVPIEEYAAEFVQLRQSGNEYRGCCPVHGGSNPHSFVVYPEDGRFYCFSCQESGDVLNLCRRLEEHAELWTAILSLSERYHVELPQRPESWYVRQDEKAQVRKQVQEVLTRSYQRRFFRVYGDVILEGIDDPTEREEEARNLFDGFYRVARHAARTRMARNA
jgi:DNA primase